MRVHLEDEFGEARDLIAEAKARTARMGHEVGRFRVRRNNCRMADALCRRCLLPVVIDLTGDGLRPPIYGWALTRRCGERGTR